MSFSVMKVSLGDQPKFCDSQWLRLTPRFSSKLMGVAALTAIYGARIVSCVSSWESYSPAKTTLQAGRKASAPKKIKQLAIMVKTGHCFKFHLFTKDVQRVPLMAGVSRADQPRGVGVGQPTERRFRPQRLRLDAMTRLGY